MRKDLNLLAFDIGNSAIRVMLCHYDGETVQSKLVLSERNEMIEIGDFFYWDMLHIFSALKRGLALAAKQVDRVDSVGICTWGIDFLLLDERDNILGNSLCYRNTIGAEEMSMQSAQEQRDMFLRTGILCDKINTIYMLRGMRRKMPSIMEAAKKLLMVPDIFVYMFTGQKWNEPSELSTSQVLNVQDITISPEQCTYAGIDPTFFSAIGSHGKALGNIRRSILEELDIHYDIPFVCVPSHDTACAVMAIPATTEEYLFVSSGTWALIGAQCPSPIVNQAVLDANLTNELGAFGRTTLLRNSAGMFITQKLKAEYELETGGSVTWDGFTALAKQFHGEPEVFDVNGERFFNPKMMVREIQNAIHPETGGSNYQWPEILASVYASIGESYVKNLKMVIKCTGKAYREIYVVGGGSKNAAINQRCADQMGLPVIACDMECSSVGNSVAQIAYFHPEYSYADLRKIIVRSLKTKKYEPKQNEGGHTNGLQSVYC